MVIQEILEFWFTEAGPKKWYVKEPDFDQEIRARFKETYGDAVAGELEDWAETAEGALALVILLDQFPRNMFRDTPKAFVTDDKALAFAKDSVAKGFDKEIPIERSRFFYLPYMHSENLADQEECVRLFDAVKDQVDNIKWAISHRDVIAKFGRFPHRNKILSRESTDAEKEYLADGGRF